MTAPCRHLIPQSGLWWCLKRGRVIAGGQCPSDCPYDPAKPRQVPQRRRS